ncbi:hypothetical protein FSP39_011310 [Pinctada imbricata]|uniref:EF-hand domain-containing protein n=1 Tax=Pinctada imbricata TaxID=66713 RepID=A0AA88XWB7_PINIB|nr:hypothetical protein FSP39_011310 [Pinctada imbricata]
MMRSLGQNPTEAELKDMIANQDVNRNGTIDYDEFIIMMEENYKDISTVEAELLAAFRVFDMDHNGYIESSELRKVLKDLGEQLSEQEVEKIIQDYDLDGDGKINYVGKDN